MALDRTWEGGLYGTATCELRHAPWYMWDASIKQPYQSPDQSLKIQKNIKASKSFHSSSARGNFSTVLTAAGFLTSHLKNNLCVLPESANRASQKPMENSEHYSHCKDYPISVSHCPHLRSPMEGLACGLWVVSLCV